MNSTSEKPWKCLRGHANEPEEQRCEVCRWPRWLTWPGIAGAGIVVLVGCIVGGVFLSQVLKKGQYTSTFQTMWRDDAAITSDERAQLEQLTAYLNISAEQARAWEAEVTGESATSAPTALPSQTLEAALTRIHQDIEHGRLGAARRAVVALSDRHPQQANVQELRADLEQEVKARIEMKLRGGQHGYHELNERKALVVLKGSEQSLHILVKPNETVYFYLYTGTHAGGIDRLYPRRLPPGETENPLRAEQTYELPTGGIRPSEVQAVYMVTSRWPARDLERWGGGQREMAETEAGLGLLETLHTRQQVCTGGCDVRQVRFQ